MQMQNDGIRRRALGWAKHGETMELVKLFALRGEPTILSKPSGECAQLSLSVGTNAVFFWSDAFPREGKHMERRTSWGFISCHGRFVKELLNDGSYHGIRE